MTFLIVTNKRDITSDYIVREIKRRNQKFFRLNTESIANFRVTLHPNKSSMSIQADNEALNLEDVKAAYFRRPEFPLRPAGLEEIQAWNYAAIEWNALLKSIYIYIGKRWLSHPSSIMIAEDKPNQLMIATAIGFNVPESIISNDFNEIAALSSRNGIIGKPLRTSLLESKGTEKVIFTNRITLIDPSDRDSVRSCPVIYQTEIVKDYDVRVTVVGNRVFATAIHSQTNADSTVDWRRGSNPNLLHATISLPTDIEYRCIDIVKRLGLCFGAIDLVRDVQGNFWFLECNPNGQWAWIENRTGVNISGAIVDELERIAAT